MINLGLTRITSLLTHLPTPQTWHAIHIAGTNGKGSVASYISSLLLRNTKPRKKGTTEIKIGKFTSPHLIDRWDCITINDNPVSEATFLKVEDEIKLLAQKVVNEQSGEGDGDVTEFELLTATAFELFSQARCQVAVIECGLGGRLDATNALDGDKVAVSVITKIGLDHQGLLGDTIEAIAREKAGIAKNGVPMVIDGSNEDSVKRAILEHASTLKGVEVSESSETNIDVKLRKHQLQNLNLALLAYQTALARLHDLECSPVHTSDTDLLKQTISDVQKSYPGRLQSLDITPLIPDYREPIILDGAHNPQSAIVLRDFIDDLSDYSITTTWVVALSCGKDLHLILSILVRPGDRIIACPFGNVDGMPWVRCVDPLDLATAARDHTERVQTANDVVEALTMATTSEIAEENKIVVAGSLYLVSDLLRAIRKEQDSHNQ